jgi:hypothetical protein
MRNADDRSKVVKLCQFLGWTENNHYSMGKSKIFIREVSVLFNWRSSWSVRSVPQSRSFKRIS